MLSEYYAGIFVALEIYHKCIVVPPCSTAQPSIVCTFHTTHTYTSLSLSLSLSLYFSPTVSTMLAMSEYYLSLTPQNVREAVRCLLGVLSLKPPPRIEAKARLKLGLLFYHHTNNLLEAREQLHQAVSMHGDYCIDI